MAAENLVFLTEFVREFQATGTICPTSKWAAAGLVEPLLQPRGPMRILEAGPGSGSVTIPILENMRDDDRLTICEINPRFMKMLRERLEKEEIYHRHRDRITFFLGPVQELNEDGGQYDVIVCAIPFLNLELPIVKDIFSKFKTLSHPETVLTYYEYIGLRALGKVVSLSRRKLRLRELDSFFKLLGEQTSVDRSRVWLNVLPINVFTLKVNRAGLAVAQ